MSAATYLRPLRRIGSRAIWFRGLAWGTLIAVAAIMLRPEPAPDIPVGVVVYPDLVYRATGGRRVRLDLYVPEAAPSTGGRPAIVAIHGGGWRGGSKKSYRPAAVRLAQHGYVVAAVDYQLSRPGAPSWPVNLEDVREAVRWLRRHARDYDIDATRIAAMGASAGGHLAALLGTFPDDLPNDGRRPGLPESTADTPSARVQAVVDFYGPTDLKMLHGLWPSVSGPVTLMLGGAPQAIPERFVAASPLSHVSRDDAPMLLIHGGKDALVPLQQSEALSRAVDAAGVPHRLVVIERAAHGFGFLVDGRDLLPDVLAFLESAWPHAPRADVVAAGP
jgi:acetyl esterase/lipase